MDQDKIYLLRLNCKDQVGIVSKISTLLANKNCNIIESKQFTDQDTDNFFIRQSFQLPKELSIETINKEFKNLSNILNANYEIRHIHKTLKILSRNFVNEFYGKIINIHHSFLPSFKGAKPYHQAFERGVKIIGATAHFVNQNLDEGPIIEQDVEKVDHELSPSDLVAIGKDIESRVLYKAIKNFSEGRVFLNGKKTIVFKGDKIL